jgi:hypothetical protein
MRETRNLVPAPTRPTLEIVRKQLETWRKRRPRRRPIPESLWQAAVGLCREHSICEVSQALRLNYSRLKHRVPGARGRSPAVEGSPDLNFVKLDLGSPTTASECWVEMEASNGARMRMSFKGGPRGFDAVELSRVFWRQG